MSENLGYIEDSDGNKAYFDYFGDEESAKEALGSLVYCKDCVNCSGCYLCSDCSGCYLCSDCSGCSGCSACSGCSGCSACSGCSGCSACSGCSGCSVCSGCSDCSGCSGQNKNSQEIHVPVINDIDKAVYEAVTAPGNELAMGNWHTCKTTHCRAGWVVHLAGEEGKELESRLNTELAAMLIYRESGSPINPARFYDNDEDAMADIKARAGIDIIGELK
jgi:hypothetical protein